MDYVQRKLQPVVLERLGQFPVVAITGPRQSGKTTLVRQLLSHWRYVTLEDLDMRRSAVLDPRGFLMEYGPGTIIDEFQRAPELVSFLQGVVDSAGVPGQYVLTGSHSYQLHEQLAQSLAGRVGLLVLHPFACSELSGKDEDLSVWTWLQRGMFPRVAAGGIPSEVWFPSFVTTYLERDVRQLLAVRDLLQFQLFIRLLASRAGDLINYSSLARDCGISIPTARHWLSVLEAGYIIKRVPPWFVNMRKQLVKTPKLYFVDTGMLCNLLGIASGEALAKSNERGRVFENWVVNEVQKSGANLGKSPELHFFRDVAGNEVDLIVSSGGSTVAIEAKSAQTVSPAMLKGLDYLRKETGAAVQGILAYAGANPLPFGSDMAVPWNQLGQSLHKVW